MRTPLPMAATANPIALIRQRLREAAAQALVSLVLCGSLAGVGLFLVRVGVVELARLGAPTHAVVQLAGCFTVLIWTFLTHGAPGMISLDPGRGRVVDAARRAFAVALAVAVTVEAMRVTAPGWLCAARAACALCAAVVAVAFAVGLRRDTPAVRTGAAYPLACAMFVSPIALLLWALSPVTGIHPGIASDLLLYVVVGGSVLTMGYQMFTAMLQLEPARRGAFLVAAVCWMGGGVVQALARAWPLLHGVSALLLCVGVAAWLYAMRALRRRRASLPLAVNAGSELRFAVLAAFALLTAGSLLNVVAAFRLDARLADLSRHAVALGFICCITVGVTLRALPRMCGGKAPRPAVTVVVVAGLVVSWLLRGLQLVAGVAAVGAVASGVVGVVALSVWAIALWRSMRTLPTRSAR